MELEEKKKCFAAQYKIDICVGPRTCHNKSITLIPCLQQQAAVCSLRITAGCWLLVILNLTSNSSQHDLCFLSVIVYMFNFLVNDRNK